MASVAIPIVKIGDIAFMTNRISATIETAVKMIKNSFGTVRPAPILMIEIISA